MTSLIMNEDISINVEEDSIVLSARHKITFFAMRVKILSLFSTVLAVSPPNTNNKSLRSIHKIYSFALVVLVMAAATWSFCGKLEYASEKLTQAVDSALCSLGTLTILLSILQGMFLYERVDHCLRLSTSFDRVLRTTLACRRQEKIVYVQLAILHALLTAIFALMYYSSRFVIEWKFYRYFLLEYVTNMYVIAMIIMDFYGLVGYTDLSFTALNGKLAKCFEDCARKGRDALDSINSLRTVHHGLCDLIEAVNTLFGFRILLVLLYTSVAILQALQVLIHFWDARDFRNNVTTLLGLVLPMVLTVLCVMSAAACEHTVKEANSTSLISYNLLLEHQPIVEELSSTELMLRESIATFASQVVQRKPNFSAAGFFPVGYTMLYGMISTILTYVVIIIQINF